MAKSTKLKLARRFESQRIGKEVVISTKKREEQKPAIPLVNVGPCGVCREPLMVAVGQQIRFHKQCREEGRKKFGRATRVVEVEKNGIIKVNTPSFTHERNT